MASGALPLFSGLHTVFITFSVFSGAGMWLMLLSVHIEGVFVMKDTTFIFTLSQ